MIVERLSHLPISSTHLSFAAWPLGGACSERKMIVSPDNTAAIWA